MTKPLPTHAQAVIIGGGIHGCSVAYHLAKSGWKDVVLLERKTLTSGTTWHAAGLVGQLQGSHSTTVFASYGIELLQEIESETGQNPGLRQPGSISIALGCDRLAELKRKADFASLFDIKAHYIETDEIAERWPLINTNGILGGIYMPSDGSANPIDLTQALAKGARMNGTAIYENTKVEDVLTENGKVTGIRTNEGNIKTNIVVNCGGMWAREIGQQNNVGVPLHACEHYYLVTEPIKSLPKNLPVLRSYCDGTYWKEDAGKLLFGFAHLHAKAWAHDGIPENFEFDSLPFIEEDVFEVLEMAMNRVPILQEVGIRTFFNGPESYSFDGKFTLGEAPSLKGYFILAGVNSTGIQSGPGAGKALAEWIMAGHPQMDLSEMDPARIEGWQAQDPYLRERCAETLVLTYAMHWPGRQRESARNLRRTPFFHLMKVKGAVFTETQGWERPGWFAPEGTKKIYDYSFQRPSWFHHAQAEQKIVRENVAIIDYSMLGKLMIDGSDAESFLQRVCTNNMALNVNQVNYTLMLNNRGGIEGDITVARHCEESFMIMSSISQTQRNQSYLQSQVASGEDVCLRNVSTAYAVLSIAGPKARDLIATVSNIDVSNDAFPFNTIQHFYIGHAPVFAQRLSYTGEIGWEIFITPDFAEHVLETLLSAGRYFNAGFVGGEALNALRIENGFLHWGHDMSYTESPHQVGLDFICKTNKHISFIGRDAYLKRKLAGKGPFLCHVKLHDAEPLLHHNEPLLKNGKVVGYITSGAFSFAQNTSIGICLINSNDKATIERGEHAVMVEGKRIPATLRLKPFSKPQT
ncbi:FAD-dependent oxidoreductase [Candidatus Puniceispirillum sp.]|nr:FAD-dependent oxidoreductase [Candidatus Puniceispirillum sp.]